MTRGLATALCAALVVRVFSGCVGDDPTPGGGGAGEAGAESEGGAAGREGGAGGKAGAGGSPSQAGEAGEAGADARGGDEGGGGTSGSAGSAGANGGSGAVGGGGGGVDSSGGGGASGASGGSAGTTSGGGSGGAGDAGDGGDGSAGDAGLGGSAGMDGGAGSGGTNGDCGDGAPTGSCPCARVAPDGDDAAGLASHGTLPFRNVQAAIDFAATEPNIDDVCVAAGPACGQSTSYSGPSGSELRVRDGISVFGQYESSGWTRCDDSTTRLLPATAAGVYFGADVVAGSTLDGFEIQPVSAAVIATVTLDGARDVDLAALRLVAAANTDPVTHAYGVDLRNGATARVRNSSVSVVGYAETTSVETVGIRAIGSRVVLEDNCPVAVASGGACASSSLNRADGTLSVRAVGGGEVVGVWLEDSPGSRIARSSVLAEWARDPDGPGLSAVGVRITGNAEGVVVEKSRVDAYYAPGQNLGVYIGGCGGQVPAFLDNTIGAYSRGHDGEGLTFFEGGGYVAGFSAQGDCRPELARNDITAAGSTGSSADGVACTGCRLLDNSIGTTSHIIGQALGTRAQATGVDCSACSEIVGNSISGMFVTGGCVTQCEHAAVGLDVVGSTLVDGNYISAGEGGGPAGTDSGNLIAVYARGSVRLQNNFIHGGSPPVFPAGTVARTSGIRILSGAPDVHSNYIDGGTSNTSACLTHGIWFMGANSAVIRNNVITGGNCGSPLAELNPGTTPAVLENNALADRPMLYRDQDGDNPRTIEELNALPDLVTSANFLADCEPPLALGSLCIDAGTSTGAPAFDRDGEPRDDGFPDVGPDEFSFPLPFIGVTEGRQHTCGVLENGTLRCWGRSEFFWGKAPPLGQTFRAVAAGFQHTCAIRTDETLTCWGSGGFAGNPEILSSVPGGTFDAIAADYQHDCGIRTDGTITCWGWNGAGQLDAPSGTFTAVAVGSTHSCGLRDDGVVLCWGSNDFGEATPPAGSFVALSARAQQGCAVRPGGSIECWGRGPDLAGWTPPPPGNFVSVQCGGANYSCGLHPNGEITCWGLNSLGQVSVPQGPFTTFTSGFAHSCAIRPSGQLACWGENDVGQATPPLE